MGKGANGVRTTDFALDRASVLYWAGNAVWLTFAASSSTTYPFADGTGIVTPVGVVQSLCYALSFFIVAWWASRGKLGRDSLTAATIGSLVAALLLVGCGLTFETPPALCIGSVALAFGKACGFCQWFRMLASFELSRAKRLLLWGSLAHIALTFGVGQLPSETARMLIVYGVCGIAGTACLALNARTVDFARHESKPGKARIPEGLPLSILCGVALTLITPIASSVFGASDSLPLSHETIVALSHMVCLVILAVVWFKLRKGIPLPRLYGIFLPIFASIIFILFLLDGDMGWVVLFIGNGCYFLVSLLMVTSSLECAEKAGVAALPLYGAFAGFMYLTDTAHLAIERLVNQGALNIVPYIAGLLLLYVLMIPTFFIIAPLAKRARSGESAQKDGSSQIDSPISGISPSSREPAQTSIEEACDSIAHAYGLSKRQSEVMSFLTTGRDVDHIARTLGLSPNTVRSYRKSLYATLGIHGRQELLDLIEREREHDEKG